MLGAQEKPSLQSPDRVPGTLLWLFTTLALPITASALAERPSDTCPWYRTRGKEVEPRPLSRDSGPRPLTGDKCKEYEFCFVLTFSTGC